MRKNCQSIQILFPKHSKWNCKKIWQNAIENLDINDMVKGNWLAKHIYQARWGILFKAIAKAAEIATRQLVRVEASNTTQTCSECGKIAQEKIKLNQRKFKCFDCKFELDRV